MGRKECSAEFKAKVVIEALKEERTINEMAFHYGVHPQMARKWRCFADFLFFIEHKLSGFGEIRE